MNEVIFGSVRSYTQFGLWLTDVDIGIPEPRRMTVDVPGRDGILDLAGALYSKAVFKNRKITLDFAMADYQRRWISLFSAIVTAIHARQLQVVIQPDTGYYWDAFATVDFARCDRNKGAVRVVLDAYPYKYKAAETTVTANASYSGTIVTLANSQMPAKPKFLASNAVTITAGGQTYSLPASSETQFDGLVLTEESTEIIVKGTGEVVITYREGVL